MSSQDLNHWLCSGKLILVTCSSVLLWGCVSLLCLYHSQVPLTLLGVDTERDLSTYLTASELFQESANATEFGGGLGHLPGQKDNINLISVCS